MSENKNSVLKTLEESFRTETFVDVTVSNERLRLIPSSLDGQGTKTIFQGKTVTGRPYMFEISRITDATTTDQKIPSPKPAPHQPVVENPERQEPTEPPIFMDSIELTKTQHPPKLATEQVPIIRSESLIPPSKPWGNIIGATVGAVAMLGCLIVVGFGLMGGFPS